MTSWIKSGAFRESNSGPLAPKARIIPLDQMPDYWCILVLFLVKCLVEFTSFAVENFFCMLTECTFSY